MRLTKLVIGGYKSIASQVEINLRPRITCLIGPNEHGKSNILSAIDLLNSGEFQPNDRNTYTKVQTHPRIEFNFSLTKVEKEVLMEALDASILFLQSELPQNEELERNRKVLTDIQTHLKSPDIGHCKIDLRSNGSRWLVGRGSIRVDSSKSFPPIREWFDESVPQVFLFEPADDLADVITQTDLEKRTNLAFEGLLKLGGVWDRRGELFGNDLTAHRLLRTAGRKITRKIRRIWSQGSNITFLLIESAGILSIRIEDPTTFDAPSLRSLGFRSFLSFYLSLFAETNEIDPEGYILLFDEPGLHLHPQGQKDLLKELRQLAKHNQVIYATHSPFLIDRNDLGATLLVRKGTRRVDKGTQVIYKPYGANWGPLSVALGISPSDAFFPPEKTLLVEGTSDRLYISRYMEAYKDTTNADLNFLYIVDSDKREELPALAKLYAGFERKIVVVADADSGGADFERLIRRAVGRKHRELLKFVDLREVSEVSKDVSIEDLLPFLDWVAAVQLYVKQVLRSEHIVDKVAIARLGEEMTAGRAAAEYLTEEGILERKRDFSKTTVAHLFCAQELDSEPDAPMAKLCIEITKQLGI